MKKKGAVLSDDTIDVYVNCVCIIILCVAAYLYSPSQHIPVHFADLYIPGPSHMPPVQALHLSICRDLRKDTQEQHPSINDSSRYLWYFAISSIAID